MLSLGSAGVTVTFQVLSAVALGEAKATRHASPTQCCAHALSHELSSPAPRCNPCSVLPGTAESGGGEAAWIQSHRQDKNGGRSVLSSHLGKPYVLKTCMSVHRLSLEGYSGSKSLWQILSGRDPGGEGDWVFAASLFESFEFCTTPELTI